MVSYAKFCIKKHCYCMTSVVREPCSFPKLTNMQRFGNTEFSVYVLQLLFQMGGWNCQALPCGWKHGEWYTTPHLRTAICHICHTSESQQFATSQKPNDIPYLWTPAISHIWKPQRYTTPQNHTDMPHLKTPGICYSSKLRYATPQNPSDIQLSEPQKYVTHLRTRDALEKLGERGHFHIAPRIDNVNLLAAYLGRLL